MKILFLTNNPISGGLVEWLSNSADEVVSCDKEISQDNIMNILPDFIISYNYKYIIAEDIINKMMDKIINLHISYLPWNKGVAPNLWSFLDDTPKGVSIHLIDKGIDTGHILCQRLIKFKADKETLASSYAELNRSIQELFRDNWEKIKTFQLYPVPQRAGGSVHGIKDFSGVKHLLGEEGWNIRVPELLKRYKKFKNERN